MHELVAATYDAEHLKIVTPNHATEFRESVQNANISAISFEDYICLMSGVGTGQFEESVKLLSPYGRLCCKVLQKTGFRRNGLACCRDSETYLSRGLGISVIPNTIWAEQPQGPLVFIKHEQRVVAVQKNLGEPSVYALTDVPKIGLFAYTFSAPTIKIRPSRLEFDEPLLTIDSSYYGGFQPKRIAQTIFSVEARSIIDSGSDFVQEGVRLGHEAILKSVDALSDGKIASYRPRMLRTDSD